MKHYHAKINSQTLQQFAQGNKLEQKREKRSRTDHSLTVGVQFKNKYIFIYM